MHELKESIHLQVSNKKQKMSLNDKYDKSYEKNTSQVKVYSK